MKYLIALALAAVVLVITGCRKHGAKTVQMMPDNAVLLDVRSAEEFRSGHLPGAVNIPHTVIAEKISGTAPDKSTPLYLYCRSGRRVGVAMEALKSAGYTDMHNLGGISEAAKTLNLQPVND